MIKKRAFLQNIFIKRTSDILALNLFNYRRASISFAQYDILCDLDDKLRHQDTLNINEQKLLKQLKDDCQILDDDLVEQLDQHFYAAIPDRFQNIKVTRAIFNLTYNCNFNCIYCYQSKYNELKGNYMTPNHIDSAIKFIEQINCISGAGIEELIISGGESLLQNNIETIKYIVRKFSNAKLTLFTNGVNLIKYWEVVQYFSDIQVSLDGDDSMIPKVNGYHQPVFNDVLSGIKKCLENEKKVSVVVMMTKYSKNNFDSFVKAINGSKFLDYENFSMRFSTASGFSSKYILPENIYSKEEYIETLQYVKSLVAGTRIGIDRIYDLKTLIDVLDRGVNSRSTNKIHSCNVEESVPLVFSPDGFVYWCSCINPPKTAIGKFFPESEVFNDKLENLVNRNLFKFPECVKCDFRYVCASGCPLYAMDAMDEVKGKFPKNCGVFKDEFFMNNLEEIL